MSKVAFKNISFKYGQNQILKDFSLEIESGEILCLVGPSGCGKTTLVRCLLGLNKPDTGEIYVGDTCIFSRKRPVLAPGEMETVILKTSLLTDHPEADGITVTLEEA